MAVATGSSPTPTFKPVHFTEAIDFLRSKTRLPTRVYTDAWKDMHSRSFVVAGAMKDGLLADFHEAVVKVIAEGKTIEDFRKDFDRIVAKHGWAYRGGRNWRSRIIFDTNLRTAYAAGRWAQAVRLSDGGQKVFLRYVSILDSKTRPQHAAWHGIILPLEHPFWRIYLPPNAWNCRCTFQIVTERDLKRYGWKVTPDAEVPVPKLIPRTINTPEGPVTMDVPEGIDPGFDYNFGEGAFGRGLNRTLIEEHGGFVDLIAPSSPKSTVTDLVPVATETRLAPVPAPLPDGSVNEKLVRDILRRAIGGDEAVFADPIGGRVSVTSALADHLLKNPHAANINRMAYWPFIRELTEAPQEIWIGFAKDKKTGRVQLRRRYVKLLRLGGNVVLGLVADEAGGYWQALTFFKGRAGTQIDNLRRGLLAYKAG